MKLRALSASAQSPTGVGGEFIFESRNLASQHELSALKRCVYRFADFLLDALVLRFQVDNWDQSVAPVI